MSESGNKEIDGLQVNERTFRGYYKFYFGCSDGFTVMSIFLNSGNHTVKISTVFVTSIILNMLFLFHLLLGPYVNTLQRSLSSSKNVAKKPVPAVVCRLDAQDDTEQKV